MSNFEIPLSYVETPPFLEIYHFPSYNWSKVAKTVSSVVNIHIFKLWGGTIEPIFNYKHCISRQALSIPGKPPADLSTLHILILFQEFIKIVELILRVQDISLLYHFLRFFCSCQQKIICPLPLILGKIFIRRNFWTHYINVAYSCCTERVAPILVVKFSVAILQQLKLTEWLNPNTLADFSVYRVQVNFQFSIWGVTWEHPVW